MMTLKERQSIEDARRGLPVGHEWRYKTLCAERKAWRAALLRCTERALDAAGSERIGEWLADITDGFHSLRRVERELSQIRDELRRDGIDWREREAE